MKNKKVKLKIEIPDDIANGLGRVSTARLLDAMERAAMDALEEFYIQSNKF